VKYGQFVWGNATCPKTGCEAPVSK
jgi:hypothetical protein